MKRSRFTEEQVIGVLKEQEAGMKTSDLCRKHGISEATFYIYGRLSCCKDFLEAFRPIPQIANIYPASPDIGAPKWEFRVVSLNKWSVS